MELNRHILLLVALLPLLSVAQEGNTGETGKGSFALFPAISYAPETSLQLGVLAVSVLKNTGGSPMAFQRQSTITPYFLYTFKKQSIAVVSVDYYFADGQNLNAKIRYYNFPDVYYGIGNDTDPDVSEQYTNRFLQIEGQFLHPLSEKAFVGGAIEGHFTDIDPTISGGLLETQNPNGLKGGNLLGAGPAFRYDTRDYTIYPSNGYFIASQLLLNVVGDFSYATYRADVRKYVNLKEKKHILAFQFLSQLTFGTDVPFYKLPQLGGDERLRGIANASLYRDRQMMYTQVEYRRPLFWRLGMTVFAGVGDVADHLADFHLPDVKYVVGLGGRLALIPERKLNVRLDIGMGRGGQTSIYVGVNEAF